MRPTTKIFFPMILKLIVSMLKNFKANVVNNIIFS